MTHTSLMTSMADLRVLITQEAFSPEKVTAYTKDKQVLTMT